MAYKNYHWSNLLDHREHLLNTVFKDFDKQNIISCGYMYAGYLQGDKSLGIRIVIIHHHSEFKPKRFDEIQNVLGYEKINGLNKKDLEYLVLNIDRQLVVKMSYTDCIKKEHLNFIDNAEIFVVIDEKNNIKEYGSVYRENYKSDFE